MARPAFLTALGGVAMALAGCSAPADLAALDGCAVHAQDSHDNIGTFRRMECVRLRLEGPAATSLAMPACTYPMEYSLEAAPDQGVVTLTIEQAGTEVVREARHEPAPLARGHVPAHRNAIARIEAGIDGDGRPFAGGFMVMLRCPPGDF